MRASKNFLSVRTKKLVYYSLFHSHLIFCLPIWSTAPAYLLKSVINLQKQAVRIKSNAKYNAHSEPLFKNLEILPFDKLTLYFNLQIMQKLHQGFLPSAFNNIWTINELNREDNFHMNLRNDQNLYIPFVRLNFSTNR